MNATLRRRLARLERGDGGADPALEGWGPGDLRALAALLGRDLSGAPDAALPLAAGRAIRDAPDAALDRAIAALQAAIGSIPP